MKKLKIGLMIFWFAGLLLLFLAASTNLVIDDRTVPVYHVSVIWDEPTQEHVTDIKNNIQRYGDIKNIEFRFCLPDEEEDVLQQITRMHQEERAGADLILIKPAEEEALAKALEHSDVRVPVICLDGRIDSDKVRVNIRSDDTGRGEALMEVVCREQQTGLVGVLDDGKNSSQNERLFQGIEEAGKAAGTAVQKISWKQENQLEKELHSEKYSAFVALNVTALEQAARLLADSDIPLYGFGYTENILKLMEKGRIRAVNAYSNFSMGWVSMQYGFKILDGESYEREVLLEHKTVTAEEMFERENEGILFPMEKNY